MQTLVPRLDSVRASHAEAFVRLVSPCVHAAALGRGESQDGSLWLLLLPRRATQQKDGRARVARRLMPATLPPYPTVRAYIPDSSSTAAGGAGQEQ